MRGPSDLTPHQRKRRASAARRARISDEQAVVFFNANAGVGGWVYDDREDAWVVPDAEWDGEGRAYWVYTRDGSYHHAVIAKGELQ